MFEVSPPHGRIFLAEQVVLSKEEYSQQKKQDNTEEIQEAKKWGLTVEQLRHQAELLSKENKERDKVCEQKRDAADEMSIGGRGERRGDEDLFSQRNTRGKYRIGPEGTLDLGQEAIRYQQLEFERLANEFKKQKLHDNQVYHLIT